MENMANQPTHCREESARQKEEDEKRKLKKAIKPYCQDFFSGGPVVGLKKCFKNMFHPHVHLHVEICANMFML